MVIHHPKDKDGHKVSLEWSHIRLRLVTHYPASHSQGRDGGKQEKKKKKKKKIRMKIVATTSLPAVDRLNADRRNAARSANNDVYSGH